MTIRTGTGMWDDHWLLRRIAKVSRITLGVLLILGGLLGFLPILGFWMLPLGAVLLAKDVPAVARFNERVHRWWQRRRKSRQSKGQNNTDYTD
jgi:hypothetical protein